MLAERITSAQNPLMRHIRKLQSSGVYRAAAEEFVCDGWKLLGEALRWGPAIKTVIVEEDCECPKLPEGVRFVRIPRSLMESISTMKTPQGVIFTCQLPPKGAPAIGPGMLLLDRIQDPGNLGTILRSADAFDIPVVLTVGCADPYSEKTLRASMGAVLRRPPMIMEMDQVLEQCRERGIPLAATALTPEAKDIGSVDLHRYMVIIGSEGQGICRELLDGAQQKIIIPMNPRCESLNAAVAAAIVMWHMR